MSISTSTPMLQPSNKLPLMADGVWGYLTTIGYHLLGVSWYIPLFLLSIRDSDHEHAMIAGFFWGTYTLLTVMLVKLIRFLDLTRVVQNAFILAPLIAGWFLAVKIFVFPGNDWSLHEVVGSFIGSFASYKAFLEPAFLITLGVVYFWQRSIIRSRRWIGAFRVLREFRTGSIVLLVLGLLGSAIGFELPIASTLVFLRHSFGFTGGCRELFHGSYRTSLRISGQCN